MNKVLCVRVRDVAEKECSVWHILAPCCGLRRRMYASTILARQVLALHLTCTHTLHSFRPPHAGAGTLLRQPNSGIPMEPTVDCAVGQRADLKETRLCISGERSE